LEFVRKQLEEDGRKTALQSNGSADKGNWNKKNCKNFQHYMEGGRHFPGLVADKAGRLGVF
jgi:hypothetical protein